MSRILELDVFAPKADVIKYKGKEYEMAPIQLSGLLKVISAFQELQGVENVESLDPSEQTKVLKKADKALNEVTDFIGAKIKDFPADDLSIGEIMAILNFMSGSAQESAERATVEQASEDDPEKKTEKLSSGSETISQE